MADRFREALGFSESGGDYGVVNRLGYTGKYQWGPDRLADFNKAMGTDYTLEEFRQDPALQENAQAWHEQDVLNYAMDNGLDYYFGKTVAGVPITPESVIAMAHLGGKSGMRQFIESGGQYNPSDAFGTSLRDYGRKFSDTPYEQNEAMMGREQLTYGPETEQAPSSADKLMTAFEMMQGDIEYCPAGSMYDPVTKTCVPIQNLSVSPRPQQRPERGAALQRLGISSLV
jgi:hypothetical protein